MKRRDFLKVSATGAAAAAVASPAIAQSSPEVKWRLTSSAISPRGRIARWLARPRPPRQHRLPKLSKNHDASFRHLLVRAFSQISWSMALRRRDFAASGALWRAVFNTEIWPGNTRRRHDSTD